MFKENTVIARDSANVGGDVDSEAKRSDSSAIEEMHDYRVNSTGTCTLPYKLQQTRNHPCPNCRCSCCCCKTNSNPDREDLVTLDNGKIADDASSLSEVVHDSSVQRSEGAQTLHRNVKYVNTCHRPGFDVEVSVSHAEGDLYSLPSHPQQSSGIVFVNDLDADCWEDYSFGDDDDNYCFTSSQLIRFENDKECQDV
jgi:hypothetical protein